MVSINDALRNFTSAYGNVTGNQKEDLRNSINEVRYSSPTNDQNDALRDLVSATGISDLGTLMETLGNYSDNPNNLYDFLGVSTSSSTSSGPVGPSGEREGQYGPNGEAPGSGGSFAHGPVGPSGEREGQYGPNGEAPGSGGSFAHGPVGPSGEREGQRGPRGEAPGSGG